MMVNVNKQKSRNSKQHIIKLASILIAISVFLFLYFGLPDTFSHSARLMAGIVSFGVILWTLEPIPMGLTALLILVMMLVFNLTDTEVVFSGFASPATHLVIAGMMVAKAVNETPLVKRISYLILKKWGGRANGLLGSLILVQQVQAIFIPSSAVRSTLMLPISSMIVETVGAKQGSNLRKMIMIGVAFGGNVSGTAIMTAAVGNILTVELLYRFAKIEITYFEWFLYTFPIWIILIPAIWGLLIKLYPLPKNEQSFPQLKKEMHFKLKSLGPITNQEWRCLIILLIIVGLWISEPFHGMHPSIPALIGAVIMSLPMIGCARWENVVQINFNTVLLLSVTLSMGYALVDSGAIATLSAYLSVGWFLSIVQNPLLAVIIIILLTQVFHKMISNVPAAVVTLIPITISVAANAEIDPLAMAFTAGLTSLYGFLLVVETMPNLLVHSTGLISQRDFLKPGVYATVITIAVTIIIAATWWKWLGLT
ncbi:DASS family sodium-coupled anion symporter [Oceanobacillus sp. FSL K6-2867]|uniref:SLC13 family permease n=1 Tax=Oceanobacillus sp. FSL K6-2867 TaxID=2954748 RepID=UPI0030D8F9C7